MQRRLFINQALLVTGGMILLPNLSKSNSFCLPGASVDIDKKGKLFKHFWNTCVGAGRANEGLRAAWLEQLEISHRLCGFRYCRFHGLFHDDMFVYREENGVQFYNWQYIDELFDRMLAIGVKPFVELGFMPKALASTQSVQFWWKGNVSPPISYEKWASLISEFTKHLLSRYGKTEVRSWYFEVWNEPDLAGFWDGTKSEYFKLYNYSVKAIKAIDPLLKVGGPATSNFVPDERFDGEKEDKTKHKTLTVNDVNTLQWHGVWIKDFLVYCGKEKLPVDFVSTHPYPTDWALDPETKKGQGRVRKVTATKDDLEWLRKTIKESEYPQAELHCTEWSSSPSSRDESHDSLPAAAYLIKANIDCIGLTDSLSYWTFSDIFEEKGAGNTVFHGGFGLINYQGIVKPAFHAYRMLNSLGDEVLYQTEGLIVTKHTANKKITVLLYHYPEERKEVIEGKIESLLNIGQPKFLSIDLKSLKPGTTFEIDTLDTEHGYAYRSWIAMGRPEPPTREQIVELKSSGMNLAKSNIQADHQGMLTLQYTLKPWTCMLINER